MKQLIKIVRRELLIILKRPVYILASAGVLIVNAVFYITFMKDGLPHDLPIGLVDEDQRVHIAVPGPQELKQAQRQKARPDAGKGDLEKDAEFPRHSDPR